MSSETIAPAGDSSKTDTAAGKTFILAHFSDLHMTSGKSLPWRVLANKRMLGYLGWKVRRSAEHREGILAVLQKDLERVRPDHIAVTGDLTHLGLPAEFNKARQWLQTIGTPARVTAVPGNHDAYVPADRHQTCALWSDYLASVRPDRENGSADDLADLFPVVRMQDRIVLIGICTAHSNPLHLATGSIGSSQLKRLETILNRTAGGRFFRVIIMHHPPVPGMVSRRKSLTDAPALAELIGRYGTELILHGHAHTTTRTILRTPAGSTTIVGASSASSMGRSLERRACYYLYGILQRASGWEVTIVSRTYSPDDARFFPKNERRIHAPEPPD